MIQTKASLVDTSPNKRDLAFVHVPTNSGNAIPTQAALGSASSLDLLDLSGAGARGWDYMRSIAQRRPTFWGPMNPDLQQKSGWHGRELVSGDSQGCPWYSTP